MADIIPIKPASLRPKNYSLDVVQYPDDHLQFTVNGVRADSASLRKLAAELERIVSIIRTDVLTGLI